MHQALLFGIFLIWNTQLLSAKTAQEQLASTSEAVVQVENLTLRASEILPQQILVGANHEVQEFVPVEQDRCLFTVRTDWGQFTAVGKSMLELRLREISVLELAKSNPGEDRKLPQNQVITISNTRLKSGSLSPRGRLLQPVKTVQSNPESGFIGETVPWVSADIRRTAFEIGCDPESGHTLVQEALEALSKREDLPDLLGTRKNSGAVPLSLLSVPGDQRAGLSTKRLEELQIQFEQALSEAGIDSEISQKFCRQLPLTTSQKWLLVRELQPLKNIPGGNSIFVRVVQAQDELAALEILQELRLANNFQTREPLKEVKVCPAGIELYSQRGEIALIRVGDYLTGNPPFRQEIEQFRRSHEKDPLLIVTPALVSPAALKVLDNNKIAVFSK